ncbi:cathepsin c, putative [Perkinsus marinus ATCC 50983]|uniref:Cathepsin c, putative n=1 Tax=Perkinsus marinus (strain ATCC 50983 / TXsc) TaxID=423536 RepID=C5KYC0_PERM5|nr:cathepsin c, putative [Perkinsus marinus ATCC 50983]EER10497.1 cathepsin c, putative [Perkinsus marinus ATCC 50983]|eukprot:XP_002778702.1 cathepsin c, putative [Perkinsus marinus ATCC 50983]
MRAFNDVDDLSEYTYFPESRTFNITLSSRLILIDDAEATQHNRHQLAANTSGLVGTWGMVFDEGFEVRIGAASLFAISRYRCSGSGEECFNDEDAHEDTDGRVKGWESLTMAVGTVGKSRRNQRSPPLQHRRPLTDLLVGEAGQAMRLKQERLRLRGMRGALGGGELSRRSPLASDLLQLLSWHQPDSYRSSCNIDRGISELDTKDGEALYDPLPMDWDWRKKMGGSWNVPLVDQGGCGSCYAIASTYALQSRINVIPLSLLDGTFPFTESVLACSWYNQACNGGLEVLALRHAQEVGIIEESKLPYTSYRGDVPSCPKDAFKDSDEVWYAKDYGYVGGFYGQCSELEMMRNLYEFGPLTVSLHAKDSEYTMSRATESDRSSIHAANDSDTIGVTIETDSGDIGPVLKTLRESRCTMKYVSDLAPEINPDGASGVFYVRARAVESWGAFSEDVKTALDEAKLSGSILDAFTVGIHGWEYVDHSVALVGWGSELDYSTGDERPYWLIRNSWSASLPGGGYIKLRRGTDAAGLESGSVWVEPDMCRGKFRAVLDSHGLTGRMCESSPYYPMGTSFLQYWKRTLKNGT